MDPVLTGKLIRKKRMAHSMTQEELAKQVFVEKATVSAWETGKTYPNLQSQMLLYKVLGINPLELITGRMMRDQCGQPSKPDRKDIIPGHSRT